MIPQHGPIHSHFHTILEDPWLHKMAIPTPMVWPLDESQQPSPLHGHNPSLMCEVLLDFMLLQTISTIGSTTIIRIVNQVHYMNNRFNFQSMSLHVVNDIMIWDTTFTTHKFKFMNGTTLFHKERSTHKATTIPLIKSTTTLYSQIHKIAPSNYMALVLLASMYND